MVAKRQCKGSLVEGLLNLRRGRGVWGWVRWRTAWALPFIGAREGVRRRTEGVEAALVMVPL
jgi:hypothetical protein